MSWAPSRTGVMHLARDGRAACAWTTRLLTPHGTPGRWCKHCAAYAPPPTQKLRVLLDQLDTTRP